MNMDPISALQACYTVAHDLWKRHGQMGENAKLTEQLDEEFQEQSTYLEYLYNIVDTTPDSEMDAVKDLLGSLERVYMRAESDIRKLQNACDRSGTISGMATANKVAGSLKEILERTNRSATHKLTMAQFLHTALSLRQAAIRREVTPFSTEGLPDGHLAGSLLTNVIAQRRRAASARGTPQVYTQAQAQAQTQQALPQHTQQQNQFQHHSQPSRHQLQQPDSPQHPQQQQQQQQQQRSPPQAQPHQQQQQSLPRTQQHKQQQQQQQQQQSPPQAHAPSAQPTGEGIDILPSEEEFVQLLRHSHVPSNDVKSFVKKAADQMASRTHSSRLEAAVRNLNIDEIVTQSTPSPTRPAASGASVPSQPSPLDPQLQEFAEQQQRLQRAEGLKLEGNGKFKQEKYAEAIECYQRAIALLGQHNPESLPLIKACFLNKSYCHLKLGEHEDCIKSSTRLLEMDQLDYKAKYRRGMARLELSNTQKGDVARRCLQLAVNDLRACLDGAPLNDKAYVNEKLQTGVRQLEAANSEAEEQAQRRLQDAREYQNLGKSFSKNRQWGPASQSFLDAIKSSPGDDLEENRVLRRSCSLELALCRLQLREYEECIECCTSILDEDAYRWHALAYRGQALVRAGRAAAAVTDLKLALKLAPQDKPQDTPSTDLLRSVQMALIDAQRLLSRSVPSRGSILPWKKNSQSKKDKAEEVQRAEEAPILQEARQLMDQADSQLNRERHHEATQTYQNALVKVEGVHGSAMEIRERCYVNLGMCAFKLNRLQECVEHCTTALKLMPYSGDALHWRGKARQKLNDLKFEADAIRDLGLAARLAPNVDSPNGGHR